MIFYFSGTGNSKHVAVQLAAMLGEQLVAIGEAVAEGNYNFVLAEGEKVGWVFPTYSWGPAPIAADFASRVQLQGYGADTYCYMVATCGDEVGETVTMFAKSLGNISLKAAFSVQMPNNYILLPGFDVDDKVLERSKIEASAARIKAVAEAIAAKREIIDVVVGPWRRLKSRLIYPLFRRFAMSDKAFAANTDVCTRCGLCARECPANNITLDGGSLPRWHGNCTMCLSCIHRCPVRAIEYGKATRSKGRYFFRP